MFTFFFLIQEKREKERSSGTERVRMIEQEIVGIQLYTGCPCDSWNKLVPPRRGN